MGISVATTGLGWAVGGSQWAVGAGIWRKAHLASVMPVWAANHFFNLTHAGTNSINYIICLYTSFCLYKYIYLY